MSGAAFAASTSRAEAAASEQPLVLSTPTGKLMGTLQLPASSSASGKFPVALIVAGSGPTDRDGNGPTLRTDSYRLLASALASKGIAVARYDKRGIAASAAAAPSEKDLRFEMYADDAAAWLDFLRADGRFDRLVLVGHSEGSLLGMLAAQRTKLDGFVSLCGPGRPAPALLHEQLTNNAPAALVAQSDAIVAKLERGETVSDVPPSLLTLYRPSVQRYLISWFHYDPRIEIAKLKVPIAIVGGQYDAQVPAHDARLLGDAAPAAKVTIVAGMSHTLKHVEGMAQAQQLPAYSDPARPIDPAVPAAIAALVKRTA
jgi:pimeloyl-ACP methyl ester carboxylesterase